MNSKVIYSVYNDTFSKPLNKDLPKKLMLEGIKKEDLSLLNSTDFVDLNKLAIHHSDGVINGSQEMMPEIQGYINELNIPNLEYQGNENYAQAYSDFYDRILNGASNDSDQ